MSILRKLQKTEAALKDTDRSDVNEEEGLHRASEESYTCGCEMVL
jgi:hypothetical protein